MNAESIIIIIVVGFIFVICLIAIIAIALYYLNSFFKNRFSQGEPLSEESASLKDENASLREENASIREEKDNLEATGAELVQAREALEVRYNRLEDAHKSDDVT